MSIADTTGHIVMVGPGRSVPGGIATVLNTYAKSSLASRYRIDWIATTSGRGGFGDLGVFTRALRDVRSVCRGSDRPVLLHVHMASRGSFFRKALIARSGRRWGAKVVLHLHGGGFDRFAEGAPSIVRGMIRRTFESADRVVVVADSWKDKLNEFGGNARAVVVPNPVVIPGPRSCVRHGCLFAGRLSERKGVLDLVEAFGHLQADGVDAELVLAGDRPDPRLAAAIGGLPRPDAVRLAGWLGARELDEEMWSAAVFCLPSHAEGSPLALLEAMARSMACVVTPVGGIPDLVDDEVSALVVPVDDRSALAVALGRLLRDEGMRDRIGAAARERVVERHAVERVVERIEALYRELGFEPRSGQ